MKLSTYLKGLVLNKCLHTRNATQNCKYSFKAPRQMSALHKEYPFACKQPMATRNGRANQYLSASPSGNASCKRQVSILVQKIARSLSVDLQLKSSYLETKTSKQIKHSCIKIVWKD